MWHLTSRDSQIRNEHGKHWWTYTSYVTAPKYYYSPASYTRSRWRWDANPRLFEDNRRSSQPTLKCGRNCTWWASGACSSCCVAEQLWAPHSDHLVSRRPTNFWQSYREAHAGRKLGKVQDEALMILRQSHSTPRTYVVMATATRSNGPRKTTMESRPTTRWACSKRNPQQLPPPGALG